MNYDMGGGIRYDSEEYFKILNGASGDEETDELYHIWAKIKSRCENPFHKDYPYYGGKGIRLCDEWNKPGVDGYEAFRKWALKNGYKPGMTVDRVYADDIYSPESCAVIIEGQRTNSGTNTDGMPTMAEKVQMVFNLLLDGKKRPFPQICEETGLSGDDVRQIIKRYNATEATNPKEYHSPVILLDEWGYWATIRNEPKE